MIKNDDNKPQADLNKLFVNSLTSLTEMVGQIQDNNAKLAERVATLSNMAGEMATGLESASFGERNSREDEECCPMTTDQKFCMDSHLVNSRAINELSKRVERMSYGVAILLGGLTGVFLGWIVILYR